MDRIPIPDDILTALKGKHGSRLHITTVHGQPEEFALVQATPSQFLDDYFVALTDDETKQDALEDLALACVVYPPLEPILDNGRPAIAVPLGVEVGKLSGFAETPKELDAGSVDGAAEVLKKHPRCRFWTVPGVEQVFGVNPPSRATWKKFLKLSGAKETKADAFRALVSESVVFPDRFEAVLDELPGLAITLGNQAARQAGLTSRVESKKA